MFANDVYWFYRRAKVFTAFTPRFTSSTKPIPRFAEVQMYIVVRFAAVSVVSDSVGSLRELKIIRLRRQGEAVVGVQIWFAVLGRDFHVEVMHDVGEEQKQWGTRQQFTRTASLALKHEIISFTIVLVISIIVRAQCAGRAFALRTPSQSVKFAHDTKRQTMAKILAISRRLKLT